MGRPPKSSDVIEAEGRSHRTKAEMNARRAGEKAALTGRKIKEFPAVKADPNAHAEFRRVTKLLTAANKNDALYEAVINRYCLIDSECSELVCLRNQVQTMLNRLEDDEEHENIEYDTYYRLSQKYVAQLMEIEGKLHSKRSMMLTIEKECAMTLASAMRNVPRKIESEEEDPLKKALGL